MELRSSKKPQFSGFTKSMVHLMEQSIIERGHACLNEENCRQLSTKFKRARPGKPSVKWTEIQSWLQRNRENFTKDTSIDALGVHVSEVQQDILDIIRMRFHKSNKQSEVELEAKSSTDGAWYDVDAVLKRKAIDSGDVEVRVKFKGFEAEHNEWVKVKDAIRRRSVPLEDSDEHSDCMKLVAGDPVMCFQETEEQAKYYDAHIIKVQRRKHDARGCRCKFVIRYDHRDNEEDVPLTRIYCQPSMLAQLRGRKDCS